MDKIVILDGHTLNPGDQDWAPIKNLGEVTIYPRTDKKEIVSRAKEATILLVNKVPINAATLDKLPKLRYIGVLATGFNIVDLLAAEEHKVVVTNVPEYGTTSVAQLTFALILELAHHVGSHSTLVKEGAWAQSPDFSFWNYPLVELQGLTMGLIGYGRIGQAVAKIARAFGLNVLAHDPTAKNADVELVSLHDLLRQSDIVSLHCPLTPNNRDLICDETLAMMKPSAWLINTARGPLIDESALARALQDETIAAAALDVLSQEPPEADNPLLALQNCIVTPHIAWATHSARRRLIDTVAKNIEAFQKGHPQNVVRVS